MERFAVTPRNDYLLMSWGGSEKNCWYQLCSDCLQEKFYKIAILKFQLSTLKFTCDFLSEV